MSTRSDPRKKKEKEKQRQSELERMIFLIIQNCLRQAMKQALDEVVKEFK